ncbi:MAG: nucleotidyltransferase family protein [Alphaproteobacteria bacterium]|nr:nucleotidyltransferase family protein [Alphaproteobacteria bacterium]
MTGAVIKRAMLLAAGRGERMRPITDTLPKVLVKVAGRALLDHALDALAGAGVELCVVNTHHLGEQVAAHLARRVTPRIVLSPEAALLDTGGGVKQALAHFGDEPFYTVNGDALWLDGPSPMLTRLARCWEAARMDALLLLHPTVAAHGYDSDAMGDYHLAPDGRARWRGRSGVASFVFAGVTVCDRRLYEAAPAGAFSQLLLWNQAEMRERLYGLRHDGEFFHVGTPAALAEAEAYFARGGGRRRAME